MTEPTPPPRRPLATFLRAPSGSTPVDETPLRIDAAPMTAQDSERDSEQDSVADIAADSTAPVDDSDVLQDTDPDTHADPLALETAPSVASGSPAPEAAAPAPSFMRAAEAAPPAPRWQWGLVAGLVVLLALQIAVADRARLAADAGSRPWIAGLCSVLRCSLPAWQEPSAFSMTSRDVRPVPGVPGALQVQASFRNDARWAQGWPSLRLSLSDADGRVIGTRVFAPTEYLGPAADAAVLLEPGQSAQIAFRVREPAASTVAFTFEFL